MALSQSKKLDSVDREEILKRNLVDKIFLISLKFICHLEGLIYIVYTIFSLCDIDLINIGYLANMSLLMWIYVFFSSLRFRFCYVHRLPLYYILLNEIITSIDYLIGIPLSDNTLLCFHVLMIGILIYLYSYYYIKK